MSSPFEIAAAAISLVHIAAKILDVTARFTAETKTVNDRSSDLISQVTLLHDVLPPVAQTLSRRQERIAERPVTPDEQSLLDAIAGVINRLHTTVQLFEEKVSKLSGPPGRWRDVLLQLKLMKSESDIASLENRINSEMSSLQLMMTCYTWYEPLMENESLPEYTTDDVMPNQILVKINENMHSFRTELNRLTVQLGVDPADALIRQEPPAHEKESPNEGWSDLTMMLNCFDAANSMIKNFSRAGSVVTSEPTVDVTGCYDLDLLTHLIRTCHDRADNDLKNENYKSAEEYLLRAIDGAKKRQTHYGIPFNERYEFEKKLAEAYLGLTKFDMAAKTLEDLKPVAETSPLSRAELAYLLADLSGRQYHKDTRNSQHLAGWIKSTIVAYNSARNLPPHSHFEDSKLLLKSVRLMRKAHLCKGDDIIAQELSKRHPEADSDHEDNGMLASDPDEGRKDSIRSCPTLPSTSISTSGSRSNSVASEPVLPPPPLNDPQIDQQAIELFIAIKDENIAAVKDLLVRSPRITWKTDEKGRTPLMCAISKRDITIAKLLVHRSPIHIVDKGSKTVFHHAVFGYKDRVKVIIDHKDVTPALLDMVDNDGLTALHQCVLHQRLDEARHLIAHGASLDIRDNAGYTAAAIAEEENRRNFKELFRLANTLVESGRFGSMPYEARYKYLCGVSARQAPRNSTSWMSTTSSRERKPSKGSDTSKGRDSASIERRKSSLKSFWHKN